MRGGGGGGEKLSEDLLHVPRRQRKCTCSERGRGSSTHACLDKQVVTVVPGDKEETQGTLRLPEEPIRGKVSFKEKKKARFLT